MTTDSPDPNLPEKNKEASGEQSDDLVKIIDESELPAEKKAELIKVALLHYSRYHEGPLPPAEEFARYNEIVPGAGDRILSMAEKEQQIRASAQERMLTNERRKIDGAVLLGVFLIGAAALAIWKGHALVAISLGLVGGVSAMLRRILDFLSQRRGD